jgi:hypothetical protein
MSVRVLTDTRVWDQLDSGPARTAAYLRWVSGELRAMGRLSLAEHFERHHPQARRPTPAPTNTEFFDL